MLLLLLLVAAFGAGLVIELTVGRRWRSLRQRATATAVYLALPPATLSLVIATGISPFVAVLSALVLHHSLKWSWTYQEGREATVLGVYGTCLLLKTDDGATLSASLLGLGRSFTRNETVRVRVTSSYLFGWRLETEIL